MADHSKYLFIADGGGSKTLGVLFDVTDAPKELARVRGAPTGLSLGVDNAEKVLSSLMGYTIGVAGIETNCDNFSMVLGLAGIEVGTRAKQLEHRLAAFGACYILSDGHMALLGAHSGRPGIVLTVGTGSVCWAKSSQGQILLMGGWGFPAGDKGSGAWIGLTAVQDFIRDFDGLPMERPFPSDLKTLIQDIAGQTRPDIISYTMTASAKEFAQFAKPVVEAARRGDGYGQNLLDLTVAEAVALLAILQEDEPLPIALNGSVALAIKPELGAAKPNWHLIEPDGDAISGGMLYFQSPNERDQNPFKETDCAKNET